MAFTLIELLVVIAIMGVLVGLLLPAVQKVRETVNRTVCENNLKQIGLAMQHYHDSQGVFPAGYLAALPYADGATDTARGWGWAALILPFLEQKNVSDSINFNLPVEHPQNASAIKSFVKVYICPSDVVTEEPFPIKDGFGNTLASAAPSSYAACCGGDESAVTDPSGLGISFRNSSIHFTDVTDGTSNTILVGERSWSNANAIWAGAINDGVLQRGKLNPCPGSAAGSIPASGLVLAHSHLNNATTDTDGGLDDFSSRHLNGSNFLFADGSVHFLRSVGGDLPNGSYTPDSIIFQALGTRANNEIIPSDWF
jgi:prepilin-type N-terminal cleavage/methylation domain-containing protein/prepilin-type processing-associated H-X9-DG protein